MSSVPMTRSVFKLKNFMLLLIAIGLFISGYLSYVKLADVQMACVAGGAFNCDAVQSSAYSTMFGIPIAVLGFMVYGILGLVLLFEKQIDVLNDYGDIIILCLGIFAWLFSMWLVYLQFFVLQALCMWCLMHEFNFTLLFITICVHYYQRNIKAQPEE
jgi:uncharacterized membrane protein